MTKKDELKMIELKAEISVLKNQVKELDLINKKNEKQFSLNIVSRQLKGLFLKNDEATSVATM